MLLLIECADLRIALAESQAEVERLRKQLVEMSEAVEGEAEWLTPNEDTEETLNKACEILKREMGGK